MWQYKLGNKFLVYKNHTISQEDNQVIKSGHLREDNIRNIFLGKWCAKCGGENSPRPFWRKENCVSLDP